MARLFFHGLILLTLFSTIPYLSSGSYVNEQLVPRVILDADIDSDVDDVGALAMLINLHKAGLIRLIGVIVTSDDPYAPVCTDAVNRFYGLEDIPVGFLKDQPKLNNHSRYTRNIAEEFPAVLKSWQDAEEAASLYRRLLAESPDESVEIVTIGHLTSLQRLLGSGSDDHSPLNGHDLVREKVRRWLCMGGQFPAGKEANFYRPDPLSTVYCVEHWKKEVIFCGWEIGNLVITGGSWLKDNLPERHPVRRSYELYNGFAGRQSWDQIAVLHLVPGYEQYVDFVYGACVVAQDGSNTWQNREQGRHKYVIFKTETDIAKVTRYVDGLMAGKVGLSE